MPSGEPVPWKAFTEPVTSGDGALRHHRVRLATGPATDRDGGAIEQTVMRASGLK